MHVFIDLVIPKANHAVASLHQPGGTSRIMLRSRRFEMLRAVEFNDQSLGEADEVDDVGAEGRLAAELVAVELVGSQQMPESLFGAGWFIPEPAGKVALVVVAVHGGYCNRNWDEGAY